MSLIYWETQAALLERLSDELRHYREELAAIYEIRELYDSFSVGEKRVYELKMIINRLKNYIFDIKMLSKPTDETEDDNSESE